MAINIGLLTFLPTITVFLAAAQLTEPKVDFLIGLFILVIVVAVIISRCTIVTMVKSMLPTTALFMMIATGASMTKIGRVCNGYNVVVFGKGKVTAFQSIIEGELSLLTIEFEGQDKSCVTDVELNCTEYNWRDAFIDDDSYATNPNYSEGYYRYADANDPIQTYINYGYCNDVECNGLHFTCEDGLDANAQYFPSTTTILVNTFSCEAAWYTEGLKASSYDTNLIPTTTAILFVTIQGISAAILAVLVGLQWRFCYYNDAGDRGQKSKTQKSDKRSF